MNIQTQNFGHELILDLSNCNENIDNKEKLAEYLQELCSEIDMKMYGKPIIEYFGVSEVKTKGYTIVQLIETSSIVGHFSTNWKTAHINIFSCKDFSPNQALKITLAFFGGRVVNKIFLERNCG
jgi:S-adenosylmethionine decarboxylase